MPKQQNPSSAQNRRITAMIADLDQDDPWLPGVHFKDDPLLAPRLIELIKDNADTLLRPETEAP